MAANLFHWDSKIFFWAPARALHPARPNPWHAGRAEPTGHGSAQLYTVSGQEGPGRAGQEFIKNRAASFGQCWLGPTRGPGGFLKKRPSRTGPVELAGPGRTDRNFGPVEIPTGLGGLCPPKLRPVQDYRTHKIQNFPQFLYHLPRSCIHNFPLGLITSTINPFYRTPKMRHRYTNIKKSLFFHPSV